MFAILAFLFVKFYWRRISVNVVSRARLAPPKEAASKPQRSAQMREQWLLGSRLRSTLVWLCHVQNTRPDAGGVWQKHKTLLARANRNPFVLPRRRDVVCEVSGLPKCSQLAAQDNCVLYNGDKPNNIFLARTGPPKRNNEVGDC